MLTRKCEAVFKTNTGYIEDLAELSKTPAQASHRIEGVAVMRFSPREVTKVEKGGNAAHNLVRDVAGDSRNENL